MKLLINSTDYTQLMLNVQVSKKLSYLGKISPNQGTLVLDAIQSYTLSDLENKTVVLKDDDDNTFFTGVTLKGKTSINEKTVQLPIKDKWYLIRNTDCTNKTWKSTSLKTIIEDVIDMTGETSYSVEDPSITVEWFSVTEEDKVRNVLESLAESIGADCYYDASGTLQFTAGFNSSFSTSTVATLTNTSIRKVSIEQVQNEYDHSTVSFVKPEFKSNKEEVYNGANSTNHWLVPAEGVGVSEDYYIKLEKKIHELEPYADVVFDADAELTLDATVYNSNIQSGSQPKYDEKLKTKITNSASITKEITEFIIEGKVIREVDGKATYSSGNNALKTTSDVITDGTWAGKLAQYQYEQQTDVEKISVDLAELDYTLGLADKFNYSSERYVIDSINITNATVRLTGYKDRAAAFSYSSSSISYERPSDKFEEQEGDGLEPEEPTNLVLTDTQVDYSKILEISWDASVSSDVNHYILQYKKRYETWYEKKEEKVHGLSFDLEVEELTGYDVRVKAVDVEEKESDWVEESVVTSQITGDGNEPDPFVFDGSECTIHQYGGKFYAHLKWQIYDTGTVAPDIKNFIIRCFKSNESFSTSMIVVMDGVGWEPDDFVEEETFPPDVDECYFEVPEAVTYAFVILVEDWDGNIAFKRPSDPLASDDSIKRLDFSSLAVTPNRVPVITHAGSSGYNVVNLNVYIHPEVPLNSKLEIKILYATSSGGGTGGTKSYIFDGSKIFPLKSGTIGVSVVIDQASWNIAKSVDEYGNETLIPLHTNSNNNKLYEYVVAGGRFIYPNGEVGDWTDSVAEIEMIT